MRANNNRQAAAYQEPGFDDNEEPGVDNSDLYKNFGRHDDVGKMLYGMYGANKQKPQVYYPPVKTKPRQVQYQEAKPCPQKTVIEYPEMPRKNKFKYNAIDFVPRRKAGEVIQAETAAEMSKPLGMAPGKAGINRMAMVEKLQERNQFETREDFEAYQKQQRRKQELLSQAPTELSAQEQRRIKFKGGIANRALAHYEQKYGADPRLLAKLQQQPKSAALVRSEQDEELEDLFDAVAEEIEERQRHLEDLGDMADKNIEARIKGEIVDRIGELQRIRNMQAKPM